VLGQNTPLPLGYFGPSGGALWAYFIF